MLKAILTKELDEKLLSEVGIGCSCAFLHQETSASRGPHQRMVRNDTVQFRPQPVYIRASQAVDPLATFSHPLCGAFCAGSLRLLADRSQFNFFFDFAT